MANEEFLATPEEIRKWRYALIDLSAVESMDINYSDVSGVITVRTPTSPPTRFRACCAVASPRDHGYGLARMWGVLVERVGWETMTFRSLADAEDWIGRRLKEKFGIDLANAA